MLVLYMSNGVAVKVNYQYGVYKVYEEGLVPESDYKTCDQVISGDDTGVRNIIKSLEEHAYTKA